MPAARDPLTSAMLVIDEAHAVGVVGPGGRGAAHAAGIAAEPGVVRTVTLSKALGAQGGAVLGAREVIGTLVSTGRSFIFDTALAPPSAAAAVVTVPLGEPALALTAQRICASKGVRVGCFRPPPVRRGRSCLRLTGRAGLAEEDFDAAARALAAVRDHVRTASPAGRK